MDLEKKIHWFRGEVIKIASYFHEVGFYFKKERKCTLGIEPFQFWTRMRITDI